MGGARQLRRFCSCMLYASHLSSLCRWQQLLVVSLIKAM